MRTRVGRRILAGVSASAAAVLLVAVFEAWPLNPAAGGAGGATPTAGESTTVLPDGRLLLVGGEGSNGSRAWLLDPQTGTIAPVIGTLSHARAWHTATVLPNGQVLIFGGIDGAGAVVQSAEVFDPATQTFSELSLAFTPRAFHTATLLLDGRVLLAGGVGDGGVPVLSVELLDVTAGAVERLSDPLTLGRSDATTTLLPNGVVVLAGGFDEAGMPLESVALIDPTSGRVVGADSFTPPVEVGPPSLVASLPPD